MFISLFSAEHGFVLTDQLVFAPDELRPLLCVSDQAQQLSDQLAQQREREEQARAEARRQGHAEGLAAGQEQAALQLAETLTSLHEQHRQAIDALQVTAADLAVDIVRKVAGQVGDAEWLVAQARRAAEDLTDQPVLKLRVHATHIDAVTERLHAFPLPLLQQVLPDESLPPDGCVLETASGEIMIDLETQLANVLSLLTEDATVASASVNSVSAGDTGV